jgi:hypothetical protein
MPTLSRHTLRRETVEAGIIGQYTCEEVPNIRGSSPQVATLSGQLHDLLSNTGPVVILSG